MTRHKEPKSGELALIRWIRSQPLKRQADGVILGPGDDCAVIRSPASSALLITTDMMQEGTDFLLSEAGPYRVGRKAMAINLSDIAAMAGKPTVAVVAVSLPREGGRAIAEELYQGMREPADAFDTTIVGGDTGSWDGPLVISVTLLGEATGAGPVTRAGARPGDVLFVTGSLGGSLAGKHLDFTPRVGEALRLHQAVDLHAMIDLSDGLSRDLAHLCEESECGAILDGGAIPIAEAASRMQDERSPLEHALHDGEDFELLFAVAPEEAEKVLSASLPHGTRVTRVGECVAEGLWLEEKGRKDRLIPKGYEHPLG